MLKNPSLTSSIDFNKPHQRNPPSSSLLDFTSSFLPPSLLPPLYIDTSGPSLARTHPLSLGLLEKQDEMLTVASLPPFLFAAPFSQTDGPIRFRPPCRQPREVFVQLSPSHPIQPQRPNARRPTSSSDSSPSPSTSSPPTAAKSRGEYLRTHFKNMREVGAALTGMKLTKAYTYLADVQEHKQVIPFRRYAGGIGRAGQAKQFGTTKGRWPEKSVRFILRLLKNAESNAEAKDIAVEDLIIKNICVQQAPKTHRRTFRAHGRINPYKGHPTHIEVILSTSDVEVPKAKGVSTSRKEAKTISAIEA